MKSLAHTHTEREREKQTSERNRGNGEPWLKCVCVFSAERVCARARVCVFSAERERVCVFSAVVSTHLDFPVIALLGKEKLATVHHTPC
ncbi:hypothetical protein PDJAM_G00121550 [Pangasius djambal]|uniref:Uncharacterized protein n=1 Tax=Pangasius djambal TaxID=1691987 RepID=A0ACC5ZA79_9TELE|nr:hypothetical protein [Pangasius djambal]